MIYTFRLNNKKFETNESKITGSQLLATANLSPAEDYELLYKINEKGFAPIQPDEEVDLKTAGIEGFKAKPYKGIVIKVDGKDYEVEECFMTPKEIMALAGINSDRYSLNELRPNGDEITYKDDLEHKIAITRKSCFTSCKIEVIIKCVIVNAREKPWNKDTISFEEVVVLQYGSITNDSRVIYTVNYAKGVSSKPEGSMVKGDVISVNNKMIFNVTQTNKS
jgi:hypothetical protein